MKTLQGILVLAAISPVAANATVVVSPSTESCKETITFLKSVGGKTVIDVESATREGFLMNWGQDGVKFTIEYKGLSSTDGITHVASSNTTLELNRTTSQRSKDGLTTEVQGTSVEYTIDQGGKGQVTTKSSTTQLALVETSKQHYSEHETQNGVLAADQILESIVPNSDGTTTVTTNMSNFNIPAGDARFSTYDEVCTVYPQTLANLEASAPAPLTKALRDFDNLVQAVNAAETNNDQQSQTSTRAARDNVWPSGVLQIQDFVGSWPSIQ